MVSPRDLGARHLAKLGLRHLGLATNARVYKGAGQVKCLRVTFHVLKSARECEGMNSHIYSQVSSHFRNSTIDGLSNFQIVITGVKTRWIEEFLISLKIFWNVNV